MVYLSILVTSGLRRHTGQTLALFSHAPMWEDPPESRDVSDETRTCSEDSQQVPFTLLRVVVKPQGKGLRPCLVVRRAGPVPGNIGPWNTQSLMHA